MAKWEYDPEKDAVCGISTFPDHYTIGQIKTAISNLNNNQEIEMEIGFHEYKQPPGVVDGPPCPVCQNEFYIRTGTCLTCTNCQYSGSCE